MTFCESHLERTGQKIPATTLGLCQDCADGKPIKNQEMLEDYESKRTFNPRRQFSYTESVRQLLDPRRKYVRISLRQGNGAERTPPEVTIRVHNAARSLGIKINTHIGKWYVDVFRQGESFCGGRNGQKR